MARTISIEVPHALGLAEAKRRAPQAIEGLARKLPGGGDVTARWLSDTEVALDVVAVGKPIAVAARIEERLVTITLALPLMLSLMAGPITMKVREALEKLLRPADAAPGGPNASTAPTPAGQRLALYQYWDKPTPPGDVAGWIAGFRAGNPDCDHHLLDRDAAAAFIAMHHGARHAAAFDACAHPAMQADFFRLCAMDATGGVYLDADMQPIQPIAGLLDRAPIALMATWKGLLNNSILLFRRPRHSFVRASLELATRIIEQRRFHSVAIATGPGVFNAVRALADPAFGAMIRDMATHGWEDVAKLIGDTSDPELAAKVAGTLDRAGWDDLRALGAMADALAPDYPTLAEDYAAITLVGTAESMAWIGQQPAAYQKAGDTWVFGSRDLYR